MKFILAILTIFIITCKTYTQHVLLDVISGPQKGVLQSTEGNFVNPDSLEPKLENLALSLDINLRVEDFEAGNFLAPSITGNYSEVLFGLERESKFKGLYKVNLNIQAPNTTQDTIALLNRILSTGGVGSLSGEFVAGYFAKHNRKGITISLLPTLNWQNSQILENTTVSNFAYFSTKLGLKAWTGPIILAVQGAYHNLLSGKDPTDKIQTNIDKSLSWNFFVGLKLDENLYIQANYMSSKNASSRESLIISAVRKLDFLD